MDNQELQLQLLNTQKEMLYFQQKVYCTNQELLYAENFHDTIKGSEWLPEDMPLSPCRWAIGYPALYVLYRILNEVRPKRILELGLGQSTKIIGMYNFWNNDCRHFVVEHDKEWVDFFSHNFKLPDTTEIVNLPIVKGNVEYEGEQCEVCFYQGFTEKFEGEKFDFICIDGPFGGGKIARLDLMGILPECLEDSFIIMFDDCERVGESNAFELYSLTLSENGIKHRRGNYIGEKTTSVIVSEDRGFICSM